MGEAPLLGGRYRLGTRIGSGGMADVHRAMDTRLQRVVAAKVFRSGADAAGRERFAEEARILAGLSHPGLVTVHDFSAGADELYLIMELVEGRTLADEVHHGALPPQRVAEIGSRLADVLAHVHDNGIVHRDVKPSNVLIAGDGSVYLADFGISRLAAAAGRMTSSGVLIGTATYMSPEQVSGGEVGYPADVYALGLVLLECATGRVEYPGSGAESAVARLVRSPEVPLELPSGLHRALLLMTGSDPARRPTAAECADLLAGRSTDVIPRIQSTRPVTQLLPKPQPEPRRSLKPWLFAGTGLGVLLVALIVFFTLPSAPEPKSLPPVSGPPGVERLPEDLATLEGLIRE
ncbi:Serine/threonine protein kinase [Saccharopolyspora antimicrobica]|uniref:non-specific serine/threonine protein kinase n=1 Tax=Saccharopolyspora antimicrobica TaxID=455193 RepID=A0A1I5BI84_9PSEU|nr:serine/threonine-protein kinase [Saccharopolyspora antimicrobica]RKT86621.1 serine/threonine protein kinase [Saccharopolyspora antimicrobica]SFN74443.1 Serine/threonine protein kinase [Saccharopolyspora antimicrobica]